MPFWRVRHPMFGRRWKHETEASWFGLASALDAAITVIALRQSAAGEMRLSIVESNPVARWFLHEWGAAGLIGFKAAMTAFVIVIAWIVGRSRPDVARGLLVGGTIVVGAVVVYSIRLLIQNR
jgi:hypothetical protein